MRPMTARLAQLAVLFVTTAETSEHEYLDFFFFEKLPGTTATDLKQ